MQAADEHPQALRKLSRERAVAVLQLASTADAHPGPFGCSGTIVRRPETVGQHQITMQAHGQVTVAASPGKGGA